MRWRSLLPKSLRLSYKLWQRQRKDQREGLTPHFAHPAQVDFAPTPIVDTHQPIKKSYLFENKIHNLHLSAQQVEAYLIHPGEVFSFWRAVGKPVAQNGYKKGRNLINGKLTEDYGGGLCQMSGILYHTSLKAGLDILERHNHSVDIYQEADRFCPLGADATVVYGYRDLRIRNNQNQALAFRFHFQAEKICCQLIGEHKGPTFEVDFKRAYKEEIVEVSAWRSDGTNLGKSVYKTG